MTYRYGVKVAVKDSIGAAPVTTGSCVVFFGGAYMCADVGKVAKCNSYQDYIDEFHGGDSENISEPLALDESAEIVFSKVGLDHAWFVNCTDQAECESDVSNAEIKAQLDNACAYICLNSSERPNILCVPAIHEHEGSASDLISSLAALCHGHINDAYSAIGVVDCSESAAQIANNKAVPAQIAKDSTDGLIISTWGRVVTERNGSGAIIGTNRLSSIIASKYALQDAANTGGVPYRSIGNLPVSWCKGLCINNGSGFIECSARQANMTDIAAKGIVTLVNLGSGTWHTWGDHTSAFSDGGVFDVLYQFDSSARMMVHLFNRFIDQWRDVIDKPMTLALRNDIVNGEQGYLDYLVAIGALIGSPRCEFKPEENLELASGYFYFSDTYTTTVPAKYIQLNLTHTTEGLKAYTEQ